MDRSVIEEKLESLRRCLHRVEQRCPADADTLARDLDSQDIVSLNLTRAVQICVDLAAHLIASRNTPAPDTMGQAFTLLADENLIPLDLANRLRRAVGFRNLAVHNYDAIDWHIVHHICRNDLADFRDYAALIVKHLLP